VNVCRTKHLSAVRTIDRSEDARLKGVNRMSLDDYLEFLADDELLEVTPENLRVRKKILNNELRMREVKRREKMLEAASER
jgi:GTP-binding protein